ncbi:hypothetical protein ACWIGI_39405 [Nocardia sp. NPDC055321]
MLWESWVLLVLFLGGLLTVIAALVADLRENDGHHDRPAVLPLELSTGSSYPMISRCLHGKHRAAGPDRRRHP